MTYNGTQVKQAAIIIERESPATDEHLIATIESELNVSEEDATALLSNGRQYLQVIEGRKKITGSDKIAR